MNSKQMQKIQDLKGQVNLAFCEAKQKENELREAGFSTDEIKSNSDFAWLEGKVWDLRFSLDQAKGKDLPVRTVSEYQHFSLMRKYEMAGVESAKGGQKKVDHAMVYYEWLWKVRT